MSPLGRPFPAGTFPAGHEPRPSPPVRLSPARAAPLPSGGTATARAPRPPPSPRHSALPLAGGAGAGAGPRLRGALPPEPAAGVCGWLRFSIRQRRLGFPEVQPHRESGGLYLELHSQWPPGQQETPRRGLLSRKDTAESRTLSTQRWDLQRV